MSQRRIHRTRQGFSYQDKYALLLFLKYLQNKKIQNFRVEYVSEDGKAIDILVIFEGDNEEVYEIKTDVNTKEKGDIGKTIKDLIEYKEGTEGIEKILITDNGFNRTFFKYWDKIRHINNSKNITKIVKSYAENLLEELFVKEKNNKKTKLIDLFEINHFIKEIKKININPKDKSILELGDVESLIKAKIEEIASLKNVEANCKIEILSNDYIMRILLEDVRRGSETGECIFDKLVESLVNCFHIRKSVRDFNIEEPNSKKNIENAIRGIKEDMYKVKEKKEGEEIIKD